MHLLVSEWDFNRKSFALFSLKTKLPATRYLQSMNDKFYPPPPTTFFLFLIKSGLIFFFNLGNIFKWNNIFLWNFRVHLTFTNHLIMSHELCNRTSKSPQIKTAGDREGTKLIRIFTPEEDRDPRRDFWFLIGHF